MKVTKRNYHPTWRIELNCTDPWCLLRFEVDKEDLRYGPYPEEILLEGDGFFIACPGCKKKIVIHHTMIYEPLAVRLRARRVPR